MRSNLIFKISDFRRNIPSKQRNILLMLVIRFPKIKLIGIKQKARFTSKVELVLKFILFSIISICIFFFSFLKNESFYL